jgi:hypothetical protein
LWALRCLSAMKSVDWVWLTLTLAEPNRDVGPWERSLPQFIMPCQPDCARCPSPVATCQCWPRPRWRQTTERRKILELPRSIRTLSDNVHSLAELKVSRRLDVRCPLTKRPFTSNNQYEHVKAFKPRQ